MLKTILRLTPAAAGLLTAGLFTACDDAAPAPCEGNECDSETDSIDKADSGKPAKVVDAGKKDGAVKDAGTETVPTPAAKVHLPCDVKAIVDKKCGTCHGKSTAGGAPMSLVDADDFQGMSTDKQKMYVSVKGKITETDPRAAMPPASSDPLSEAELATLSAWLDKGAPGSDKASCAATSDAGTDAKVVDPNAPYVPPTDEELDCHKLLAHNGDNKTAHTVGLTGDVYYAFVYAAPWKETAYGVVVRSIVDNEKALHHWLLFQDVAPGIPGGGVLQIGAHPTGQLLAAWAPGADPMDFRKTGKEVGLELPANTTYTLEFHYNSDDANAKDASGVEVCVAKQKPKNIAAYSWLGYDNLGVPSKRWEGTCTPLSQEPITIVSFMPHMHLQGIHMKGTINRKNGTKEVVHDKPFDFNYQRSYPVDLTLNPGDTITTVCDYAQPAVFGQPTDQEMCYLFAMAYPKGALSGLDIWGGVAHGASSCLGQ